MDKIKDIKALEILDSKGFPTLEATVITENGLSSTSSVPCGQSKGEHEASDLRDGGSRYEGQGVLKSIGLISNKIKPELIGRSVDDPSVIDKLLIDMDDTENKSILGGNTILAISQTIWKVSAKTKKIPLYKLISQVSGITFHKLPTPLFNVIEGGKHALLSQSFQEILLVPLKHEYSKQLEFSSHIFHMLEKSLINSKRSNLSADEGGFALSGTVENALDLLKGAISESGYAIGSDFGLGLDAAASSLFENNFYNMDEDYKDATQLLGIYENLIKNYNIVYIEDPFSNQDENSWKGLLKKNNILVVGDDLICTNYKMLEDSYNKNLINAAIIKPNQIGTITEAIDVCLLARKLNVKVVVSHRSKETTDDFIADLAVGVGADYAKFGAPARERIAKYNRLLRIEKEQYEGKIND